MDRTSQGIINAIRKHDERCRQKASVKKKSRRRSKSKFPSEEQEQLRLVTKLKRANLLFMHAPMGGGRGIVSAARMKRMGARKGFPDLVVYQTPPGARNKKGVAIELKRARPAPSKVSPEQTWWLEQLDLNGFACRVCYGCDEAIEFLNELGWKINDD